MPQIIRDVLTPVLARIPQTATVGEALQVMLTRNVSELYVTDANGRLLGIVADYSLLKASMNGTAADAPVNAMMGTAFPIVAAEAPIDAVAPTFREGWCREIPVISDGVLVGIVTRREILRVVAAQNKAAVKPVAVPRPAFLRREERVERTEERMALS